MFLKKGSMGCMGLRKQLVGLLVLGLLGLVGCKNEPSDKGAEVGEGLPAVITEVDEVGAGEELRLEDVVEITPSYIVGISYPKGVSVYPGLVRVISAYSQQQRDELMVALEGLGDKKPDIAYELSLAFEVVSQNADFIAVAADGTRYTGDGQGEALMARFVWLKGEDRLLEVGKLIADAEGWKVVSEQVWQGVHDRNMLGLEGEKLTPEVFERRLKAADRLAREGTLPVAGKFAQFRPLLDSNGRVIGLRFVFAPGQVRAYSQGTQEVDVSVAVVRPYIAAEYAGLFVQ